MSQMHKSILDPSFVWRGSASTDVAETFRRVRSEMKAKSEQEAKDEAERKQKVEIIRRRA
jgi:hypothetical protein